MFNSTGRRMEDFIDQQTSNTKNDYQGDTMITSSDFGMIVTSFLKPVMRLLVMGISTPTF
ncbi:LOW QUALITY PROTEIN: hypothetical protein HID58_048290 [Brassica napus]|uniref:Uncharacterized protein n=1 Tax=Brassica napus TaxID=3708 RepID=A0ABQ8B1S1_BRANA|nr:LOW QUALITY PROTEIN: hypothetical protein HID58_048290 [Brassica napus]